MRFSFITWSNKFDSRTTSHMKPCVTPNTINNYRLRQDFFFLFSFFDAFLLDDRRDISELTLCESRRLSWKNFIESISKLNTTSFIHVYVHCFIDFFCWCVSADDCCYLIARHSAFLTLYRRATDTRRCLLACCARTKVVEQIFVFIYLCIMHMLPIYVQTTDCSVHGSLSHLFSVGVLFRFFHRSGKMMKFGDTTDAVRSDWGAHFRIHIHCVVQLYSEHD